MKTAIASCGLFLAAALLSACSQNAGTAGGTSADSATASGTCSGVLSREIRLGLINLNNARGRAMPLYLAEQSKLKLISVTPSARVTVSHGPGQDTLQQTDMSPGETLTVDGDRIAVSAADSSVKPVQYTVLFCTDSPAS